MLEIRKMRAAILVELNKELILDEVELPETLSYGQVLVKLFYTGICGSQLGEISGVKGPDKFLPHLLGHEGSGKVIQTGPGVKSVRSGDSVVLHWRKGSGIEGVPPQYRWNGRRLNAGFVTTFNEFAIVSENRLTRIPDDFNLQLAPLFGCAVTTGFGVVMNNARLKIGESIVVFGAGGVGLNVIQGAAMTNAYPIIAVDLFDNRLELALKMGASHIVNSSKQNPETAISEILGSEGADVVVDNTGNTKVIALAYRLAKPQGKTILVGVPKAGDDVTIHSLPLHFGKILTGSHGGESNPEIDIPRYVRLYQNNKLILKDLVTDVLPFEEINFAIEKIKNGSVTGRCILSFN